MPEVQKKRNHELGLEVHVLVRKNRGKLFLSDLSRKTYKASRAKRPCGNDALNLNTAAHLVDQ